MIITIRNVIDHYEVYRCLFYVRTKST